MQGELKMDDEAIDKMDEILVVLRDISETLQNIEGDVAQVLPILHAISADLS